MLRLLSMLRSCWHLMSLSSNQSRLSLSSERVFNYTAITGRRESGSFQTHLFQFKCKMLILKMLIMSSLNTELTGVAQKKNKNTHCRLLFLKKSLTTSKLKYYWYILQQMSKLEFPFHSLMVTRGLSLPREKRLSILKKNLWLKQILKEKRNLIILRNRVNGLFRASYFLLLLYLVSFASY